MMNLTFLAATAEGSLKRQTLSAALGIMIFMVIMILAIGVVLEVIRMRSRSASQRNLLRTLTIPVYFVGVLILVFTIICGSRISKLDNAQLQNPTQNSTTGSVGNTNDGTIPTTTPTGSTPTTPTKPATPTFATKPHSTASSDPSNWNIKWEINVNGSFVPSYQRPEHISFGSGDDYFALPGIAGFRGNNYRDSATYGTVN